MDKAKRLLLSLPPDPPERDEFIVFSHFHYWELDGQPVSDLVGRNHPRATLKPTKAAERFWQSRELLGLD
jgi:hypothetical protein